MSLAVRVIPCLNVDNGRVVKGVNFVDLRDAGDPVELARAYDAAGADELVSRHHGLERRSADHHDVVSRTADQVFIPLTVGGGVRTVDDIDRLLRAGADKAGINTAAISRPEFSPRRQIDSVHSVWCCRWTLAGFKGDTVTASGFEVTTHGGRVGTGIDAVSWAAEGASRGAGEILLNSWTQTAPRDGFDTELIEMVRREASVPVIASGGAGKLADFAPAVAAGADAGSGGKRLSLRDSPDSQVKAELAQAGYPVRL